MKRIPCSGCSLLCDDIIVRTDGIFIDEVIGACLKGKERFDQATAKNRILSPMIRKSGKLIKVSWEEALNKALNIINNSSKPLLYGFSNVSCEAQLKALELARHINGFIDSNASICQGKVLNESVKIGLTLSTITEVINKADLIVLWGANPAESIPRLLNKTLFSRGKFRMTGREIKTLVIIDPVKTASFRVMGVRDLALQIETDKDIDLIHTLKEECCVADSIPTEGVAGIDRNDLKRLILHLTEAEYGVVFIGQGVLKSQSDSNVIKEFLELLEMANSKQKKGRITTILLGGHFNMNGFDHVALAFTGQNQGIEFSNGNLIQSQNNVVSKIASKDFDCSIIVGTDAISHLPYNLSSNLAQKPIILIDNRKSATFNIADVVLPTAITGIECEGLAFRLDHVPIQLKRIINPPSKIPSDESLLSSIIKKVQEKGE